jgi:PAS domain S-box-containing protein
MENYTKISQNNAFLKMLFENISEGLLIVNDKFKIIDFNPRLLEMFEYNSDELLNNDLNVLIPVNFHKKHNAYVKQFKEKPKKKQLGIGRVLEARTKNNQLFYIETSLNHLTLNGKKYFVALITNITKRVEAEKKLRNLNEKLESEVEKRTKALFESQALYTAVARNFPNGTINIFNKKLNYLFAEGKELYKLGITSKKLIGTSYLNRLPSEIKPNIEKELLKAFKGEERNFELNYKNQVYFINVVPLNDEENNIDKILLVETNITKEKEASKKLELSLKKEKEINEMKSRFVSMASHQFRTPLSTILSSTSLIDSYIKKDKIENTAKHIKRIKNSVKGLTDILNDFLSSDKLESQMVKVNVSKIDVNIFLNDLVEILQTITKEGQNIKTTISTDCKYIHSDSNILKNIIFNLISNAIKYSNENQDIYLNVYIANNNLSLNVIDNGIGIPLEDQKNLFTRFFRAQNAQNYNGTGLGLNIIKSYLDLLKGNINFESQENKGTKFTVEIPLKNE